MQNESSFDFELIPLKSRAKYEMLIKDQELNDKCFESPSWKNDQKTEIETQAEELSYQQISPFHVKNHPMVKDQSIMSSEDVPTSANTVPEIYQDDLDGIVSFVNSQIRSQKEEVVNH